MQRNVHALNYALDDAMKLSDGESFYINKKKRKQFNDIFQLIINLCVIAIV